MITTSSIWIFFKPLNDHCFEQFWINLKKQCIPTFNYSDLVESIGWSLYWSIGIFFKPFNDDCFEQSWINLKKVHLNLWQFWFSFEHRDHYFEPFWFCFRICSSLLLIIPILSRPSGDHYIEPFGNCSNFWIILFSIIYFHLNKQHIITFENSDFVESIGNHFFELFGFCSNDGMITVYNNSELI